MSRMNLLVPETKQPEHAIWRPSPRKPGGLNPIISREKLLNLFFVSYPFDNA
jgi:hypothetical protein